jgi:hypothetical protein
MEVEQHVTPDAENTTVPLSAVVANTTNTDSESEEHCGEEEEGLSKGDETEELGETGPSTVCDFDGSVATFTIPKGFVLFDGKLVRDSYICDETALSRCEFDPERHTKTQQAKILWENVVVMAHLQNNVMLLRCYENG